MSKYSKLTDEALLPHVMAGDEAAFRELYDRYDAVLYSIAYRKLGNRQEAQDLVQDVLVSFWNNRSAFKLQTTLAAYFYRAVLNRVFNIYKHRRVAGQFLDESRYQLETAAEEADFLIREKDIAAAIQREIDDLPPRMREIYLLKKQQHLSTHDIAEQLDISEHTVSTQLKRAMKQLRLRLGLAAYLVFLFQ